MKKSHLLQFFMLMVVLLMVSCQTTESKNNTVINWENHLNRPWVGHKVWPVPFNDWSVNNGAATAMLNTAMGYGYAPGEHAKTLFVMDGKLEGGNFKTQATFAFNTKQDSAFFALEFGHKWEEADDRSVINRHKRPLGTLVKVSLNGMLEVGGQKETIKVNKGDYYHLEVNAHEPESGEVELIVRCSNEANEVLAETSVILPLEKIQGMMSLNFWAKKSESESSFKLKNFKISGESYQKTSNNTIGPVMWSMYSLNKSIVKINAQMAPLGKEDDHKAYLEIETETDKWEHIATTTIDATSYTALFRLENWDATKDVNYRISYTLNDKKDQGETFYYKGTIRKDPIDKEILTLANANCTKGQLFPYTKTVQNLLHQNPDIVLFSGDQLYEDTGEYRMVRALGGADHKTVKASYHNYLGRLAFWGWAFRDLMRDRPTIVLTDDHDVYQGNLWGENGVAVFNDYADHNKGGYPHHPDWVNAVQRAQMAHNPDPYDPTPIGNNISVHYGDFTYGRVSFAMLEDRKFKSGPSGKVNMWPGRPDHVPTNLKNFSPSSLDKPGLKLLGERQLQFLEHWVEDWNGADMKCLLSQTIFCNVATHHGGGQRLLADLDTNGWPQTGRNTAVDIIRKASAPQLAGDQHLPSLVQYGIDEWNEASYAFTAPAVATGYPRRWYVDDQVDVNKRYTLENTGEFKDGLGNRITVHGVGNPKEERGTPGLWSKTKFQDVEDSEAAYSSGYALIVFNKKDLSYTFNAYKLQTDARNPANNDQFSGFPRTIHMEDNFAKKTNLYLPQLNIEGANGPILIKVYEEDGTFVYARKIIQSSIKLPVYKAGNYKVLVSKGDEKAKEFQLSTKGSDNVNVKF